jgi:DNA-binding response OmpR family regulator
LTIRRHTPNQRDFHVVFRTTAHTQFASESIRREDIVAIRVLIADPDEYLWTAHCAFLEEHGILATHVTNGLACLRELRGNDWDLLVIDPSIPWGGGDGVLALMSEDRDLRNIPVMILTAVSDRRILYRMAPFRIADVRSKPLSRQRLLEGILATHRRHIQETRHEESQSVERRYHGDPIASKNRNRAD